MQRPEPTTICITCNMYQCNIKSPPPHAPHKGQTTRSKEPTAKEPTAKEPTAHVDMHEATGNDSSPHERGNDERQDAAAYTTHLS